MRRVRVLAAVAALVGLAPLASQAQQTTGPRVEVLYEGSRAAAICSPTSTIVGPYHSLDFTLPPGKLEPTAEIERLSIEPGSSPVRQQARIYPGWVGCADDYLWSNLIVPSGHSILFMYRWPPGDKAPVDIGGAADVDVSGPGFVFVPRWTSETIQETRKRIPGDAFLLLPGDAWFHPRSVVQVGTSPSGLPLLLAVHGGNDTRSLGLGVIEAGQDPVRLREPALKIAGVSSHLQTGRLGTLDGRPLLQFAYRDPEQPTKSYIVGAATCVDPRSFEALAVDCSPLFQLRLPFGETYPSNLLASELDQPPMLSLPQGGTRAFVAIAARERTCIRVTPLNASTIADTTGDCPLEVAGQVLGMAAASDSQLLVVSREDRPAPTFRLLRISGL